MTLAPAAPVSQRFEAALTRLGGIDEAGLDRARRFAGGRGLGLPAALTTLGLVSERDVARALAEAGGWPLVAEETLAREARRLDGVGARFLRERRLAPFAAGEGPLRLAMADPLDDYAREAFRLASGLDPEIAVAEASAVAAAVDRLHGGPAATEAAAPSDPEDLGVERLKDLASEAPVVQFVGAVLAEAIAERASDIHFEPLEAALAVRYRIDGALRPGPTVPERLRAAVISRVKIMAKLDIAERRLPQDGRIRTIARGRSIDLRVSTMPLLHGESVAIRVLDRDAAALDFAALGLGAAVRARLDRILALPNGVFLVTGPTGSGKTTTLYAALAGLRSPERKMLTVEDPVEYQLAGVSQVQVRAGIGLDFARVLRSMLRHDPDVIMVGEIRDGETARIAAQAALTGHLVLSTLHTNDAAGAVVRLADMGIEDYLLTATLNGVAAQRLVRRLCPACREPYAPPAELAARFALPPEARLWRPKGCDACGGRGFRGRTAIMEVMEMTDRLRSLVFRRAEADAIRAAAREEGMVPMFEAGLALALEGATSLEEIVAAARIG